MKDETIGTVIAALGIVALFSFLSGLVGYNHGMASGQRDEMLRREKIEQTTKEQTP